MFFICLCLLVAILGTTAKWYRYETIEVIDNGHGILVYDHYSSCYFRVPMPDEHAVDYTIGIESWGMDKPMCIK